MLIHEAIRATTDEKPFITRKSWFHKFLVDDRKGGGRTTRVIPSDSPGGCPVVTPMAGYTGSWKPSKADLIADDWETAMFYTIKKILKNPPSVCKDS